MNALRVDGVDLSHYQGYQIDFTAAKKAGVKFFYHKVTEGNTVTDENYDKRRIQAGHADMPFGGYHFAHPGKGDAKAEAQFFLQHLKFAKGDLVPMLDLESTGGLGKDALSLWVKTWMLEVEKATGVKPILYTQYSLGRQPEFISDHGALLWTARYSNTNADPGVPAPFKHWDIWQFSNGVYGSPNHIAGFPGNTDLNHMRDGLRVSDFTSKIGGKSNDTTESTGTFRICTQNVQSLPLHPQGEVSHDVNMTAGQSGIIGWQEISPDRYRQAVSQLEADGKWITYWGSGKPGDEAEMKAVPGGYDSPISWRTKYWDFVKGGRFQVHKGLSKVMQARYATWVLLKHKGTGALLIVVNFHLVSSAWNNEDKPHKEERPALWKEAWQVTIETQLEHFIKEHPDAAIALTGDYNANLDNKDIPWGDLKVAGRRIVTTFPHRIDHVFLINGAKYKWVLKDEETLPGRNSDHQGARVQVKLSFAN